MSDAPERKRSRTNVSSPPVVEHESVDASEGPSVPALSGWGMGLAAGLLLLVGTAVVRRSRARAA